MSSMVTMQQAVPQTLPVYSVLLFHTLLLRSGVWGCVQSDGTSSQSLTKMRAMVVWL